MKVRVSIRSVMAVVLAAGLGLAALRSASEWWASGVFSATLMSFALAAAYATQRRGARRACWSAFVAFGVGYMALAFGPWCEATIRPRLATTKLLDALLPVAHPGPVEGSAVVWNVSAGSGVRGLAFSPDGKTIGGMIVTSPPRDRFLDIGHCLAAWLLASLGGFATRSFYERRDERRREAVEKAAGALLRVLEAGL
jgi:hypothetical protein